MATDDDTTGIPNRQKYVRNGAIAGAIVGVVAAFVRYGGSQQASGSENATAGLLGDLIIGVVIYGAIGLLVGLLVHWLKTKSRR